jgi:DNA-binding MarR family transcriptional regulator
MSTTIVTTFVAPVAAVAEPATTSRSLSKAVDVERGSRLNGAMTRPLRDVGLSVKRLQMRHHRALNAALARLEVSIVQWDALRHLDENPGASLHDLARLTFQSDQAFGTLASRMIDRGLIERVPGPGRAVRHRLTDEGRKLRRAGDKLVERALTESFGRLTPKQLAAFDELLVQLLSDDVDAPDLAD